MKSTTFQSTVINRHETTLILLVSLTALLLRLYRLGANGLWFDEIGVALALRAQSLPVLITNIRLHVMAMPLDYVTNWLLTRGCQSEACLRLPAALWGAFTIPLSILLFRRLAGFRVAILAAALLAVSPIHLNYSQELRFYASLCFFYILSTLLLLRAMERQDLLRWLAFTMTIIIGSYFHIYVSLSLLNGYFWLTISKEHFPEKKKIWIALILSSLVSAAAILPGYFYFKGATDYGMFSLVEAIVNVLIGLGWLPLTITRFQAGLVWYLLFFYFFVLGLWSLFQSKNKLVISMLLTGFLQIGFIFSVNALSEYALRGRQLLFIIPIICLTAAMGIENLYKKGSGYFNQHHLIQTAQSRRIGFLLLFAAILIGTLLTFFSLQSYYLVEKSNRREITAALIQNWQPGDSVWITPGWEKKYYGFYLDLLGHREIQEALIGIEKIEYHRDSTLPVCWITKKNISAPEKLIIHEAGFQMVPIRFYSVPDSQLLWCRLY